MGNCRSCEPRFNLTTKLILLDGGLQKFTGTVHVSDLLRQNPDCFICSSDEMGFDELVAEVGGNEVLRPGEIYFEFPLRWRNHRLQAEEIAALAVKASVALSTSCSDEHISVVGCCCCVSSRVVPRILVFSEKERLVVAEDGGGGWEERGGADCKGRKFVTKLSVIEE